MKVHIFIIAILLYISKYMYYDYDYSCIMIMFEQ